MSLNKSQTKRTWIALLGAALLFTGGVWAGENPTNDPSAFWAQMAPMRNIMHYGVFTATPLDNGVQVNITAPDAELAQTIRQTLSPETYTNSAPYPDTVLVVTEIPDGVSLVFTSENALRVQQLKNSGTFAARGVLRNAMHAQMQASGYGPGMMGGAMMGQGQMGSGMMGGKFGAGFGHGPGMMGGNFGGGFGHGPGMMGQSPQAPSTGSPQ